MPDICCNGNNGFKYCCCLGDVMIMLLALSAVECGFDTWLGKTKDYKTGICYLFSEHMQHEEEQRQIATESA